MESSVNGPCFLAPNAYSASSFPTPGRAQLAAAPFMRESKLEDFETETLLTLVVEKDVLSQRKEAGLTAVAYHTTLGLSGGPEVNCTLVSAIPALKTSRRTSVPLPVLALGP